MQKKHSNDSDPIFVTRPSLPDKNIFLQYVDTIWESRTLTNFGPLCCSLEQQLSDYFDVEHVTSTANGHLALEIALQGLELQGEVITTPFTFASTVHAIRRCGLKPVFADIREHDLTLNPEAITALINKNTAAIVPVHVYGHPCDCTHIEKIAHAHNIPVIYDAAHAFGVRLQGRSIASYGDVSIFSFHATKLFHTIEGGALAYSNKSLKRPFRLLQNFGIKGEDNVFCIGGNAKMNEFQAAMGLANLPSVPALIEARRKVTQRYRDGLADLDGIHIFHPEKTPNISYNYAYFPILVCEEKTGISRDTLYNRLQEHSIYARRYFFPLAADYPCYKNEHPDSAWPVATRVVSQVLCLPIYAELTQYEVDRIIRIIHLCLGNTP